MDPEEEIPVSCTQCSPPVAAEETAAGEKAPRPSPGRRAKNLFSLWIGKAELNDLERSTFRRHVPAAALYGIFFSILNFGAFIMRKDLGATEFQVTLYIVLSMFAFIFSTVGTKYLSWRNHRKYMMLYSFLGPLSLAGLMLYQHPYFFIALIFWVQLNHALYMPGQNMIFRSNYRKDVRGLCYARAQMIRLILAGVTAEIVGRILHLQSGLFIYVFSIGGAIGFISYLLFVIMPRNPKVENLEPEGKKKTGLNPFGEFFSIMKSDVIFRKYEIFFFIYGSAFFITWPLMPLFVNDVLNANYKEAAKIFGVIQAATCLVFIPLFGRLLDRTNAIPVAAVAFLCLAFWPFSFAVASSIVFAYLAAFFLGLGMAGVDLAWMLGAQTFASEDKIQGYHAVHVTMVGLRAVIVPFIGYGLMKVIGYYATFAISGGLFLLAAVLMITLNRERARSLKEQGNKGIRDKG